MLIALFLVVAILLVAFGGLMAAVDAAIGVQSRAEIAELAPTARFGRSLGAIAADPAAHVNAVNFVRVISETAAAVLVTLAFASLFEEWWLTLIVSALLMTGVSFVLVGVSPRSVGRAHAELLLRLTAPLVHAVRVLLGPATRALVFVGNKVTPSRARSAPVSSEEQLLSIVDEATALDVLEEDDRELIHSIFEFNDTIVREVMVPRTDMITIDADDDLRAAMSLFLERGVSRVPVVRGAVDDVVGVLYLRDVARYTFERTEGSASAPAVGETPSHPTPVELTVAHLAKPAAFIPESKKADATLRDMQTESNHLALVVDEYGGIAGLVTLEDLIEELVGEISDEYDSEVELVEPLGEGRYRVGVRLAVDELGDIFGLELDDEDVDTAGGLFTKALGRLPEAGSTSAVAGLRFTADRIDGRRRRLATVIVERDPEPGLAAGTESGPSGLDSENRGDADANRGDVDAEPSSGERGQRVNTDMAASGVAGDRRG